MDLNGVGVIVTGGASGLGRSTVLHLAEAGAKVAIFDLDAGQGRAVASEVGGLFFQVDIADEVAVDWALAEAEAAYGKARVLVNCAGIGPAGTVIQKDGSPLPLGVFAKVVTINLVGTFNMLSKFAARLHTAEPTGEERGIVINTVSIAAYEGQIGQAAYSASKGGIVGMTVPIARELARYGIRVMGIAPGIFLTPLLEAFPLEVQQSLARQVPFPSRLGEPREFARLVESIIRNPMLNGEVIRIDGALRMGPR